MHVISKSKITLGSLIVLIIAGASTLAYAAVTDTQIVACVAKNTGFVRIIGDKSKFNKCLKNEYQLAWNMQGVEGAAGKDGADGQPGVQGPQGEPGASNWNEDRIARLEARIAELEAAGNGGEDDDTSTTTEPYEATLKLRLSQNNPDSTTIVVDEDDNTDGVTIFAFETEATGGDVLVDTVVIKIETPETDIARVVDNAEISVEGNIFDSARIELLSSSTALYYFETDGDYMSPEDEYVEVELQVTLKRQLGNYPSSQLIKASLPVNEFKMWEAEGSDDLAPSDFEGSAIGETHTLLTAGLLVDVGSIETTGSTEGDNGTVGVFEIEFEATALEGDFYIRELATNGAQNTAVGVAYEVAGPDGAQISAALTSTADKDTNGVYTVRDGETESFTLTVIIDPTLAGLYRVTLREVNYSANSNGTDATKSPELLPESDYRTNFVAINNN